ncbi:MAG: hypothetical protein QGG71_21460 [Pirellulaceae bacterium]|nr:hypothetical protein [Pirellulaceae bacterium]
MGYLRREPGTLIVHPFSRCSLREHYVMLVERTTAMSVSASFNHKHPPNCVSVRDKIVDVTIKKVSHSNGGERFLLVDSVTRRVLTTHDTSEQALRRFFAKRSADSVLIDECFERARQRYAETTQSQPSVDHAADTAGDDLLAGLGLDDDFE